MSIIYSIDSKASILTHGVQIENREHAGKSKLPLMLKFIIYNDKKGQVLTRAM